MDFIFPHDDHHDNNNNNNAVALTTTGLILPLPAFNF
jgi:hypothetical protein